MTADCQPQTAASEKFRQAICLVVGDLSAAVIKEN
jgi:hypothetical protein